jgi:hypothetical protein
MVTTEGIIPAITSSMAGVGVGKGVKVGVGVMTGSGVGVKTGVEVGVSAPHKATPFALSTLNNKPPPTKPPTTLPIKKAKPTKARNIHPFVPKRSGPKPNRAIKETVGWEGGGVFLEGLTWRACSTGAAFWLLAAA